MDLNKITNENAPETRNINVKNVVKGFSIILLVIGLMTLLIFKKKGTRIEIDPPSNEESLLEQEANMGKNLPGNYGDVKHEIPKESTPIQEAKSEPIKEVIIIEPEKPKQLTDEEKEQLERAKRRRQLAEQARTAPLKKSAKGNYSTNSTSVNSTGTQRSSDKINQLLNQNDPNETAQKKEFARQNIDDNFILGKVLVPSISRYEVKAGTFIPVVMSSYVESDNPGKVVAVVSQDIYDTINGSYRVIPKGTRLLGEYNSDVSFGQERLQIIFTRLMLPNGKSISLGSMIGGDGQGRSGVKDKVNTHMGKVFCSVLMSAILGAGAAIVSGENSNDNSWSAEAGQGAGEQILAVGANYSDKVLNTDPTLLIRAGTRATLLVDKDIILEPYNSKQEFLNEN